MEIHEQVNVIKQLIDCNIKLTTENVVITKLENKLDKFRPVNEPNVHELFRREFYLFNKLTNKHKQQLFVV